MPDVSGREVLRRLEDRKAEFPVIVLTGAADVAMAVEALKTGAADFIEKPYAASVVLAAVRQALDRLDAACARGATRRESAGRLAGLSSRERDVLDGIVAGRANKEIARRLGISPRTVEVYRANLMIKTGANSVSALIRLAVDAGGRQP
jgi:two-component system response regulator FixJ